MLSQCRPTSRDECGGLFHPSVGPQPPAGEVLPRALQEVTDSPASSLPASWRGAQEVLPPHPHPSSTSSTPWTDASCLWRTAVLDIQKSVGLRPPHSEQHVQRSLRISSITSSCARRNNKTGKTSHVTKTTLASCGTLCQGIRI